MKIPQKTFLAFFILIIVVFLSISNAVLSSDTTLNSKFKRITIASEPDYPPYCIIDKNGNADGFSIDLFKAAANAVGIDVDIKIGIWNQIKQDLVEGKIDALPLVGRTPEREELYDFTMPYLRLHGAVFVRNDSKKIKSLSDLNDKIIAVMKGDNAEEYVRRQNITDKIITPHTFEEAFRLLDSKEVDAVVVQKVVGLEIVNRLQLKKITALDAILPDFRQDFCIAVQKGNTNLLSRLNEGLSIVIANKTFDELHHKWFGPTYKEVISTKDIANILLKTLVPLLLLMSIVFIVVLRRTVKLRTTLLKREVIEHKKTNRLLEKMEIVSNIGGWDFDVSTKQIAWTKGVYCIHGVEPNEFNLSEIDRVLNFYHPDDKAILNSAFNLALETGEPYDLELRFTDANGVQKWVRTNGQAEFQDEKIIRLYGSIMDITQNKLAQIAIKESELRIREVFNSTSEAIIIHNAKTGTIIDCNDRTLEIYGYSNKEDFIGKGLADISINEHPYNEDDALNKIHETIKKGSQTFEWIAKKKNGSTFWTEVSLRHTELNNEQRILAVVRDTTERKKSEFEFLRLNNEIQAIFKASKPLQYLATPENLAYEIIQVLEDILNYEHCAVLLKADDGVSLIPFALSDQGKGKEYIEMDKKYIQERGAKVGKGIVGWVAKNGKSVLINDVTKDSRYFSVREDIQSELCVPIISESTVIGVINVETTSSNAYTETDLRILETMSAQIGVAIQNANLYQQVQKELIERTAIEQKLKKLNEELEAIVEMRTKELEEQVLKLDKSQKAMLYMIEDLNDMTKELKVERQKLEAINKELESFSYSVSHDLRAPLRAIDGFSKIFIEDYKDKIDEEGIRLLKIISESSQKMDKLITDLLTLSRVSRNKINYSKINMTEMAQSVFSDLTLNVNCENIKFSINDLPSAFADPILIRQVWQNLIGNALKYSKSRPIQTIEIGGLAEDGYNTYYVKDNGVGFDPEYSHKIFEIFQRLHSENEFEGTGVGLSIVQRVINKHSGRVWAEGVEGEGATFWFALPIIK